MVMAIHPTAMIETIAMTTISPVLNTA